MPLYTQYMYVYLYHTSLTVNVFFLLTPNNLNKTALKSNNNLLAPNSKHIINCHTPTIYNITPSVEMKTMYE